MTESSKILTPHAIIQVLIVMVLFPLLPIFISGRWDWWEAWVNAGFIILGFAISRLLAARMNPDLLVERSRFLRQADAKSFDKILAPILMILGAVILVVAGMDRLWNWSHPFSLTLKIIAILALIIGYALGTYAFLENPFFSGMVRIQAERGQRVIASGPYRLVRHPGYASSLFTNLAIPVLLDSSWALIPAFIAIILLAIRTCLEDRCLQDELEGYKEYTKRVRYRWIPGIW